MSYALPPTGGGNDDQLFDRDSEEALLAALMIDPYYAPGILEDLPAEAFFVERNRHVYRAIAALHLDGGAIDLVTVTEKLRTSGKLSEVGGPAFLAGLAEGGALGQHAEEYARIVMRHASRRAVLRAGQQLMQLALRTDVNHDERLAAAETAVMDVVRASGERQEGERVGEALHTVMEHLNSPSLTVQDLNWGITDLDRITNGLPRQDLVILAGRPSMGKTTVAAQVANHNAARNRTIAFFSLEMSNASLTQRLLAGEARVDLQRIRTGRLTDRDWERIAAGGAQLESRPLYLFDRLQPSLGAISRQARRLANRTGIDLIVIDYLQLMEHRGMEAGNRNLELAAISRGLKALARELDVPVLVLSQLSRAVESRNNKRPMLQDLRDSGAIEQDADTVVMVYRDDYYTGDRSEAPGTAELIVTKQRNGPTGTARVAVLANITRYADLARPGQAEPA